MATLTASPFALVGLTSGSVAAAHEASPPPVHIVSGASHIATSTNPVARQKVRITIRGHARGGRYFVARDIRFGDGTKYFGPVAKCAVIKHPPKLHRDPFRNAITHTWKHPGTYHLRYTFGALCEPNVPTRTVQVTVHVSAAS